MSLPNWPLCCYCGGRANGRVVFIGREQKIVDNPFCREHFNPIYKQTDGSIQFLHEVGMERTLLAIQRWDLYQTPPAMPSTKAEFVKLATAQLQSGTG